MVSIIIPVFNVEKYLPKCLNSCFNQTYKDIEVVAVDDGSTDMSGRILDEYAIREPRLKVFHQQNKGVVYARELGLIYSKGDYICFVDSDDYIEKEMIYTLLETLLKTNCDVVACDFLVRDEHTHIEKIKRNFYLGKEKEAALESLLLRYCTWSLCGKLFKKGLFELVQMPYGVKVGEDGLVCFQAFNNCSKVEVVNQPYYIYIQRRSSVTHSKNRVILSSIIEFIIQIVNMREHFHWGANLNVAMNTFIASQVFVYYVNGGELNILIERIRIPFTIREMLRYDLRIIEKVGLLVFFKMNSISYYLRKLYVYATSK